MVSANSLLNAVGVIYVQLMELDVAALLLELRHGGVTPLFVP